MTRDDLPRALVQTPPVCPTCLQMLLLPDVRSNPTRVLVLVCTNCRTVVRAQAYQRQREDG